MFNYRTSDPTTCRFYDVISQEELKSGERAFVQIGRLSIVVLNIEGEYFAIADVCSHDDGPLGDGELDGWKISCPRHGAQFDVRTGKALTLPAIQDIPTYPVRVKDGMVQVGIPNGA
ncbi:MAG: non-heme iron oxygenase ferredoxin subunit [Anaerolineales bacterium]|nr:non-heme iron oxygenase ferredoxin subunit [Anaerolineales bacterium]MDW8160939.1 non-heme iron oxygenase ferredoxin subunit [Anaerolineales bacterium]